MDRLELQHLLKIVGACLILLVAGWLWPDEPEAKITQAIEANGSVDRVVDGDTVDVWVDGEVLRVRLIGIDTPETVDPRKDVECFGREASEHLKELLNNQQISLEYDPSQGKEDRYGRALAYLILPGGQNVAEQMLADGFAYEYTYSKPYEHQAKFKIAEQQARETQIGLWSSDTCGGER